MIGKTWGELTREQCATLPLGTKFVLGDVEWVKALEGWRAGCFVWACPEDKAQYVYTPPRRPLDSDDLTHDWQFSDKESDPPIGRLVYWCPDCLISTQMRTNAACPDRIKALRKRAEAAEAQLVALRNLLTVCAAPNPDMSQVCEAMGKVCREDLALVDAHAAAWKDLADTAETVLAPFKRYANALNFDAADADGDPMYTKNGVKLTVGDFRRLL
jgi:hypothetical protein